ncbi:type 1 glutamine amidotransferase domain-containing protein [Actinopolymorpha rutila]|uniref:Aldehyde dehydrogenase (NAD+) n=1 Tax=Actinopolymorpha rutila TaxID=446787 RepID=A0A852ZPG5_9ACTN|nr:type 1 glutamine amidotransferase domain-containing protein [Actinopolymorpha rutila]NYH90406.1 aldehyde dehydrogenase (NAD+) [Actinopolymorpha rutila]
MTAALIVISGADHWTLKDGTRHPTGYWAEELVVPHRTFRAAGVDVTLATPGGAAPTVDRSSLTPDANGGEDGADAMVAYLATIQDELSHPATLEDVDPDAYDLVFYPGGHGPMEDLATNDASGRLLTKVLDSGAPVGVLCHAPAALLAARRPDGSWPFAGYRLTSFTDAEEAKVGLAEKAPWLLQDRLVEQGARFVGAPPFTPHTVVDRNLYTGQNPASSAELAEELLQAVRVHR